MDNLDLGETIKGFSAGQKVFARYTLTRILGRGGMGVVWLARDEELEREVALKFLPEVVAADKEAVKELKRETRRSLELTHSHIVRIYDFVQDARTAAISMEYIAGDTLSSRKSDLDRGHFEPAGLSAWVAQLCSALDYAHGVAQIVHRDLKPANLMVDARGHLKIADFGIATSISDSVSRVSKQAGSSGTPVYMSPQQMMGERPAVTDDIYALGATLYDLLSGKPPFYSGNIIAQVQGKIALSITERRKELGLEGGPIPPEWEQTIAACLAKDPQDRPQSAGEVAERLGLTTKDTKGTKQRTEDRKVERLDPKTLSSGPVEPGLRTGSERVGTPRSTTSKTPLYAGLAATVLLLGGLGWYFGIHAPEQKRLAAQARIEAERAAAEQQRIKIEQEKMAVAEKERKDRAAAEAREREERDRKEAERLANARGGIVVRTNPPGAEVRVGAVALEKSPLTLKDQRLGKYPVRVRLDGYEEWTGEVEVKENEFADLDVALVRSTGTAALASDPPGLEVEVVGRAVPGTPAPAPRQAVRTPADLKLPTGTYDLTFRRPGWPEQKRTVEIGRNQTATATAEFVPGSLLVESTPAGADVWIAGQVAGRTPLRLPEVLPGAGEVELKLKGHKSSTLRGTIEPRRELRLAATLEKQLFPQPGQPWENTLGQKFVPVPGTGVLFCIWETRVQDFEAFVRETGHDATQGMYSDRGDGWRQQGDTWKSPGFPQGPTHPVVGVNQADAKAFCEWLTKRERAAGRLDANQSYRLPTDAEWDAAVGRSEFPWGNEWPPPRGAGNYADEAAKRGRYKDRWIISGYDDGHDATAPVGSFTANAHGLYDLGGNVWEYVDDRASGLRGASFRDDARGHLASSYRYARDLRNYYFGFRVVCAVGSAR